jgi:SAM-dependent methyltransferase
MIFKIRKFLSLSLNKKLLLIKSIIFVPFYYLIFFFQKLFFQRIKSYKDFKNILRYPQYLQTGTALRYIYPIAEIYCKGKGLDIGGGSAPFSNSRNIDPDFNNKEENSSNENALNINEKNLSQDYIFSSHCLEHLDMPFKALREFKRVLKDKGIIFLYLPHPGNELWLKENLEYHLWQPTPKKILRMFNYLDIEVIEKSFVADAYHSFHIVGTVHHDKSR